MSSHRGCGSPGKGAAIEITTTLYDLMETIDESLSSIVKTHMPDKRPALDRVIARKVAGMFLSGLVKFKHPGNILKTYPEWSE
jgi:hypothetical protein